MEEQQRLFLLRDCEETVADFRMTVGQHRGPGPRTRVLIDGYDRAIAWLHGRKAGDGRVRDFFEGRLDEIDEELDYEDVVFEHDAYAAAIEALR